MHSSKRFPDDAMFLAVSYTHLDKKPSTPNTNGNKETPSTDKKETIKNTSDVATGDSTNTLPFVILSLSTLLVDVYKRQL